MERNKKILNNAKTLVEESLDETGVDLDLAKKDKAIHAVYDILWGSKGKINPYLVRAIISIYKEQ